MVSSRTEQEAHDEELGAAGDGFVTMLDRLNKLSLDRRHDAYLDIDWDDPRNAVGPGGEPVKAITSDPVRDTEWFASLTPEEQDRFALYRAAACMRIGWQFENLLQRGLLWHAMWMPNGSPEFRYVHHELIEESQHTLMFQEFVNRSGIDARGMPVTLRLVGEYLILPFSVFFPAMFFLFILGGEDPVDHVQRLELQEAEDQHPLLVRIFRIHVTEEARHLSFAQHYLRREVPELGAAPRAVLAVSAPVVLGIMSRLMLEPPSDLRRACDLPLGVVRKAFRSDGGRTLLRNSVGRTRRLWTELGLTGPLPRALWRLFGIWEDQ